MRCLADLCKKSWSSPPLAVFSGVLCAALSASNMVPIARAADRSSDAMAGAAADRRDLRRAVAPLPVRSAKDAVALVHRQQDVVHLGYGSLSTVVSVLGALGMVLGLFLLLVWLLKRGVLGNARLLPPEVVESLGSASFAGRQQVHLLRVGHKLVLVSVTAAGTETLTEITDREEVDRLAGLCVQRTATSSTAAFRRALRRFSNETAPSGFVGRVAQDVSTRSDRGSVVGRVPHG